MKQEKIKLLFVCLGNICRSPMAEYVMREKIKQVGLQDKIETFSAGTSGWHNGEDMHCGTADMLDQHKIDSHGFRSSQVKKNDWQNFDYVIAMDDQNLRDLTALFEQQPKNLLKITALTPTLSDELGVDHIPDPWYTKNFAQTYELLDRCCDVLLNQLKIHHRL